MSTTLDLKPHTQNQYSYEELLKCGHGELFGPGNARLPLPPMMQMMRDVGGVDLPEFFGKLRPEPTPAKDAGSGEDGERSRAAPPATG